MTLDDVIGDAGLQEVLQTGAIRFHAVGDTGRPGGSERQTEVTDDMTLDYHPAAAGQNPAFFLHLGDVIYGPDKKNGYLDQFFRPYCSYPGKIIAIPGNHDGDPPDDLQSFWDNFCAPAPVIPELAAQQGIEREMVAQPGLYWLLDAPFVQIIGLYSNKLEDGGTLDGANNDSSQKDWLAATLKSIAAQRAANPASRKALIVATHHPPYASGGHSGSQAMLNQIDAACQQAGIMYDAFLSGHAHNYQRYSRSGIFNGKRMEIPFIVAGGGGNGLQKVDDAFNAQPIADHTYECSLKAYSYIIVTVTALKLTIAAWQLPSQNQPFDTVTVDLQTNLIST